MAFKTVTDLSADTTISLGGINKKTGKANPKSIEGFYLGKRSVEDRKKKSGVSFIYTFQTPKGNVGVWGKTDLDRKMQGITPGVMTRATHVGMVPTPNGEMYKYEVAIDAEQTIEVTGAVELPEEQDEEGGDAYGLSSSRGADSLESSDEEEAAPALSAKAGSGNNERIAAFFKNKK